MMKPVADILTKTQENSDDSTVNNLTLEELIEFVMTTEQELLAILKENLTNAEGK